MRIHHQLSCSSKRRETLPVQLCLKPDAEERRQLESRYDRLTIAYHELAEFYLPEWLGTYLDYGCGPLTFARRMEGRFEQGHGVDVVLPPVTRSYPARFQFQRIAITGKLPYPDSYFDSISLVEVIEHVPAEQPVLEEVARVLKKGGTLVITTPHQGLFTWIDPGNWKFSFPTFHRWVHLYMLGNRDGYEQTFGSQKPEGMVGDISGDRHRHYSVEEFVRLVPATLRILRLRVSFPGMRLLWTIALAGRLFPIARYRDKFFGLHWARWRLSRLFGRAGDQLVIVLTKE
jgi:SAM-dependent methyltransferase